MAATGDDFLHDPALEGDSDSIADNVADNTEVPGWLIAAVTPPDPDTDSIE